MATTSSITVPPSVSSVSPVPAAVQAAISSVTAFVTAFYIVEGRSVAFSGSATFVDANTLVSARHIFANPGVLTQVNVDIPGKHITLSADHVHLGGPNVSPSSSVDVDWAVVSLDTPEGLTTGWAVANTGFTRGEVFISGTTDPLKLPEIMSGYAEDRGFGATRLLDISSPGLHGGLSGGLVSQYVNGVLQLDGIISSGNPGDGWAVDISPQLVANAGAIAAADDALVQSAINQAYVDAIFRLVGLNPTRGEVKTEATYWAGQMTNHDLSLSGLYTTALGVHSVQDALAYEVLLGRDGYLDTAGMTYWKTQRDGGMSFHEMVARFMDSPEFHTLYGGQDISGIVTSAYWNAFGRIPEPAGLSFYVDKASRVGVQAVLEDIVLSQEALAKAAPINQLDPNYIHLDVVGVAANHDVAAIAA